MNPRHDIHIDHVRGLAIFGVFAHHFSQLGGASLPYFSVYGGLLGVQLFFVLSGYLIADSASRHPMKAYAIHRLLRIFPAYWLAYLAIGFGLTHSLNWAKVVASPGAFLLNMVNLQQIDPVALFDFDVLSVSWSLTVEVLWYLVAPLVVWFGRHRPWMVLAILLGISALWTWLANTQQLQPLFENRMSQVRLPLVPAHSQLLINAAFPAQIVHFGWGALLYFYRDVWARLPAWLPWLVALPLLVFLPNYLFATQYSLLISGLGMAAFMLGVIKLPNIKILPLAWLGTVSYSVYLLHVPIIVYCHQKFGYLGAKQWPIMLGMLTFSAIAMYRLIERPGMSLARRMTK